MALVAMPLGQSDPMHHLVSIRNITFKPIPNEPIRAGIRLRMSLAPFPENQIPSGPIANRDTACIYSGPTSLGRIFRRDNHYHSKSRVSLTIDLETQLH